MPRMLLLAAAAAIGFTGMSTASAQECVNGYRMVREIPMPCDGAVYSAPEAPIYVEPVYPAPVYRPVYPRYGYGYGYGYGGPIITGSIAFGNWPYYHRHRHFDRHWGYRDRRDGRCWTDGNRRRGRC